MKSTRMVCSVLLLSSTHFLVPASSSSGAGELTLHKPRFKNEVLRRELIALENESMSSIASASHLQELNKKIDRVRLVLSLNEQANTQAKDFISSLNPDAKEAYYVRAVLDGFENAELDETVRAYVVGTERPLPLTAEQLVEQEALTCKNALLVKAFSGAPLPKKIRFALTTKLAKIISNIEDPSLQDQSSESDSSYWSYFISFLSSSPKPTFEPIEVKNFNALQQQMLAETDSEKKATLIKEWDKQLTDIHGHAVTYLTKLLEGDLGVTLARLEEAESLYAQDDSSSIHQPSSSNS